MSVKLSPFVVRPLINQSVRPASYSTRSRHVRQQSKNISVTSTSMKCCYLLRLNTISRPPTARLEVVLARDLSDVNDHANDMS